MIRFVAAVVLVALTPLALAQETAPPLSPPESAQRQSGLAWIVMSEPTGPSVPAGLDFVTIDYTGWNMDGEVFDSTARHPDVRTFPLARLSSGLQQTIATMKAGEKRRVWIPAELSPKKVPVVFDIELLEITRPLEAPVDVAAVPSDAERSKSGLAWRVLKAGAGDKHPKANSAVVVHYTGWTSDGTMFDSSVERGKPSELTLDAVIPGWREGLRMMVPGERRRLWIPARLAYRGERGKPQGMLVFDVELVRFN